MSSVSPGAAASSTVRAARAAALEALYEWTIDRIHLGAFDPKARIEVMDDSGIWAQICFPNSIGLGGQGISDVVKDPELRLLCVQIYNDAMAEVQADSGGRLMPMPVLPAWDPEACVREAQRVAGLDLARREHDVGPARPRSTRPGQPGLGPVRGTCAPTCRCPSTSTSAPASPP